MKKISSLLMAALALPMAMNAATDYTPAAPADVLYQTNIIRTYEDPETRNDVKVMCDYGFIEFRIPFTYADGHSGTIAKSNLSYRILVNDEETPFIFQGPDYVKWEQNGFEPMEWIEDGFSDYWDFAMSDSMSSTEPTYHKVYLYNLPKDVTRVGVQSRFTRGKNVYDSEVTWSEPYTPSSEGTISWNEWLLITAVDEVKVAGEAEYFDLQGRKVAGTEKGLLIKKTQMTDGSVRVQKVVR